MAVTPDQLLRPAGGELDAEAFAPRETAPEVEALLELWIAEGEARAEAGQVVEAETIDAVTAHHAYARAFDTLWARTPLGNASASLEGVGSKAQGADQRAVWKQKRDEHEAEAARLIAVAEAAAAEETGSATASVPRSSFSRPFYVRW